MAKRWHRAIASGVGLGYLPLAPGTWASAVAAIAWYFVIPAFPGNILLPLLLVCLCTIAGVYTSSQVTEVWGKDPKQVVIDEIAGMWIALLFIPITIQNVIAALLLFRLFDIWKPLGIRKAEKAGNGWGVMLDDVIAGIVANILLQLILKLELI